MKFFADSIFRVRVVAGVALFVSVAVFATIVWRANDSLRSQLSRVASLKASSSITGPKPEYSGPFEDYVRLHRDTRDNPASSTLTWVCERPCSGFGDRIKGIMSTFFLSTMTGRIFYIEQSWPSRLESFVGPALLGASSSPVLNWTAPNHVRQQWQNQDVTSDFNWLDAQINGYTGARKGRKCNWIRDVYDKIVKGKQHIRVTWNFHWEIPISLCIPPSSISWPAAGKSDVAPERTAGQLFARQALTGLKERGCRFHLELWQSMAALLFRPVNAVSELVHRVVDEALTPAESLAEPGAGARTELFITKRHIGVHLRLGSKFDLRTQPAVASAAMMRLPAAVMHIVEDRGWSAEETAVIVAADSHARGQEAVNRLAIDEKSRNLAAVRTLNVSGRWEGMYHVGKSRGEPADLELQERIMVAEWFALGQMDALLVTGSGFVSTAAAAGGVSDIRKLEIDPVKVSQDPTPPSVCPGDPTKQDRLPAKLDAWDNGGQSKVLTDAASRNSLHCELGRVTSECEQDKLRYPRQDSAALFRPPPSLSFMDKAKVYVYGWPSGEVGGVPVFGPVYGSGDAVNCNPWKSAGKCEHPWVTKQGYPQCIPMVQASPKARGYRFMYQSELLFAASVLHQPALTTDPDEATMFVVPHSTECHFHNCLQKQGSVMTECQRLVGDTYLGPLMERIRDTPQWRRHGGADHFMVFAHDQGSRLFSLSPRVFNESLTGLGFGGMILAQHRGLAPDFKGTPEAPYWWKKDRQHQVATKATVYYDPWDFVMPPYVHWDRDSDAGFPHTSSMAAATTQTVAKLGMTKRWMLRTGVEPVPVSAKGVFRDLSTPRSQLIHSAQHLVQPYGGKFDPLKRGGVTADAIMSDTGSLEAKAAKQHLGIRLALFGGTVKKPRRYSNGTRMALAAVYGSMAMRTKFGPEEFVWDTGKVSAKRSPENSSGSGLVRAWKPLPSSQNASQAALFVQIQKRDQANDQKPDSLDSFKENQGRSCLQWYKALDHAPGQADAAVRVSKKDAPAPQFWLPGHITAASPHNSYKKEAARSLFLIAPQGWASWTPRPVEGALIGRPVVVMSSDQLLPGSDFINWDAFTIRLPASPDSVGRLECILRQVPPDVYLKMRLASYQAGQYLNWATDPLSVVDWMLGVAQERVLARRKACEALQDGGLVRGGLQVGAVRVSERMMRVACARSTSTDNR